MTMLQRIWIDQRGQDLIEYALLAAFVAFAGSALVTGDIVGRLTALLARAGEALDRAVQ